MPFFASSQSRTARASASVARAHRGEEGGLAQPFLVNAGGMQQFVGNDGIEHAHAPFVENAHDRLFALEFPANVCPAFRSAGGI